MLRLFVAVAVPPDRAASLRALETSSLHARWTPPEQYHVTLRFLGSVDEDRAHRIADALGRIELDAFETTGDGLLVFPSRRRPRVLAVYVSPVPGLIGLREAVDRVVTECDVEQDSKPFRPHVTLARLKHVRPEDVHAYVSRHAGFMLEPFQVTEFHLYRSDTRPEGALHSVIGSYRLKEP